MAAISGMEDMLIRGILQAGFKCLHCGTCCRICRDIHVADEDITNIAKFLGVTERAVRKKYTRRHSVDREKRSLRNKRACVFFDRLHKTCKIYEARPYVCRVYPFLDCTMLGRPITTCFPDCPGQMATAMGFMNYLATIPESEVREAEEYFERHPAEKVRVMDDLRRSIGDVVIRGKA